MRLLSFLQGGGAVEAGCKAQRANVTEHIISIVNLASKLGLLPGVLRSPAQP